MASQRNLEGKEGAENAEDGDTVHLQHTGEGERAHDNVFESDGEVAMEQPKSATLNSGSTGGKGKDSLLKENGQSSGGQDKGKGKIGQEQRKKSFVDLFRDNRTPSHGLALHKVENNGKAGTCKLAVKNLIPLKEAWGSTLIGFFAGRDPGKWCLSNLIKNWGVKVKHHYHKTGWIVFEFLDEKDMMMVLNGGPYFAGYQPLILKHMPQLFRFEDIEMKTMPVWITFPNLPKQCWGVENMSTIASLLGEPMRLDMRTSTLNAAFYARALVMVDASTDLLHEVTVEFDDGTPSFQQVVLYDYFPTYCTLCKTIGHKKAKCHLKDVVKNKVPTLTIGDSGINKNTDEVLVHRLEDSERTTKSNEPVLKPGDTEQMDANNEKLVTTGESSLTRKNDHGEENQGIPVMELTEKGNRIDEGKEVNEVNAEEVQNGKGNNNVEGAEGIDETQEVIEEDEDVGSPPKVTPIRVLVPVKPVGKNKPGASTDSANKVATRQGRRNKDKSQYIGGYKPPNRK